MLSSMKCSSLKLHCCNIHVQTLLHEMCHAAAWLIDGELRPPHGPRFWCVKRVNECSYITLFTSSRCVHTVSSRRYWAKEATRKFPDLEVTRCHSYQIQFKHIYRFVVASLYLPFYAI